MKHLFYFTNISGETGRGHQVAACNNYFIKIYRNRETFILALFTKFSNYFAAFLRTEKVAKAISLNQFF